jgi:uncharacterized membrane protein
MIRTALVSFILILLSIPAAAQQSDYNDYMTYARAQISDIQINEIENPQGIPLTETWIFLKILDGDYKGEVKKAVFSGENELPEEMKYNKGDKVFIGISAAAFEGSTEYISIYDMDNTRSLVVLLSLMVIIVIFVGRLKGFASLLALIVTIALLFLIFIPATLKGYPSLPVAIVIAIISVIITLPIIAGFQLKTLAAILGAICGIIFSSILAYTFGSVMHLAGIITNEMLTVYYASNIRIDMKGLVLSGMIIAALGAIMDVCISIASSTAEIFSANPEIDEKTAYKSVLNIGTDILGSMVNTLVLAYVGSSLALILFISIRIQPEMSFWMVLNYNLILGEIVKSAIGSIGLFISIPITALISVKIYKKYYSVKK